MRTENSNYFRFSYFWKLALKTISPVGTSCSKSLLVQGPCPSFNKLEIDSSVRPRKSARKMPLINENGKQEDRERLTWKGKEKSSSSRTIQKLTIGREKVPIEHRNTKDILFDIFDGEQHFWIPFRIQCFWYYFRLVLLWTHTHFAIWVAGACRVGRL